MSISTTSSRLTRPSLSRSSIWNPSRISRTWDVGSRDRASLLFSPSVVGLVFFFAVLSLLWLLLFFAAIIVVALEELRVGESGGSLVMALREEVWAMPGPRGVQLPEGERGGVEAFGSLEGVAKGFCCWV